MLFTSRAERFARALDGGPVTDARTARMLGVVQRLDAVPRPAGPASLASGGALLAAAASVHAVHATAATVAATHAPLTLAGLLGKLGLAAPAWAPLATGALAVGVAFTGFSFATSQALPGDHLYSLKSSVQDSRMHLASAGQASSEAHLVRADERMADLVALQRQGDLASRPAAVGDVLAAWTVDTRVGVDGLVRSALAGSASARTELQEFVVTSRAGFAVVTAHLPAAVGPQVSAATAVLGSTVTSLGALTPAPAPITPAPAATHAPGSRTGPSTPPTTAPATRGPATPTSPARPGVPTTLPTTVPTVPLPPVALPTVTLPTVTLPPGLLPGLVNGLVPN